MLQGVIKMTFNVEVYDSVLRSLSAQGLITLRESNDKVLFQLTEKSMAYFKTLLDEKPELCIFMFLFYYSNDSIMSEIGL